MARADLFVHFDDVPFTRKDWRSRNRILLNGEPHWLSVPTVKRPLGTPILEIEIDYTRDWTRKHRLTIESAYRRTPYFDLIAASVIPVLETKPDLLVDLDLALAAEIGGLLGIETPCVRSSQYQFEYQGKSDRVLQLCRRLDAGLLYDGNAARAFIEVEAFAESGIAVQFQDYQHPVYAQRSAPFVSHLSVIDLIAHVGPKAGDVVRSGGAPA